MSITEILLLILGAGICAAGFLIPERYSRGSSGNDTLQAQDIIRQTAETSVSDARKRINEIVSTESGIAQDDTERALDRITNEKIMAVNEYGKTVLEEIEKNHKEVMFLYDMLNNKSVDIKNTVRKAESVVKSEAAQASSSENSHQTESVDTGIKQVTGTEALKRSVSGRTQASIKVPKAFAPAAAEKSGSTARTDINPETGVNDRIVEMHENGRSDVDIAKTLGIGVGEVRLKIGLVEAGRRNEA